MFHKVLVANRGAVAARVLRALKKLNIRSVAVYSEADRELPYLAMADETYAIGPPQAAASYLDQDKLLAVLRESGADGVHPGYGFLSENAGFAEKVEAAGAGFIGPSPRWIAAMGHKTRARELMAQHGMPMGESSGLLGDDPAANEREAERIGYPVLIKPAGGGGGIGMVAAHDAAQLHKALEQARSAAARSFGNAELYLERLVLKPRHVEFQILADRHGHVRHIFERDCSVQRRHQKVMEEATAPNIPRPVVDAAAERMAEVLRTLRYDVIGTVETLYDGDGNFNFLEMNTRLQVEHAVTEEVTGIDLVAAQLRLAWGDQLDDVLPGPVQVIGHAVQARIYAEDPMRFLPSPGLLETLELPVGAEGIRVETGYATGNRITPFYDPMIAKVIAHGRDRDEAIARLDAALAACVVRGVKNNIPFVRAVLAGESFRAGRVHTGLAAEVVKEMGAAKSG